MYNNNNIDQLTMDFINNRDIVSNVFSFEYSQLKAAAADVFCAAGVKADEAKLMECRKIIKKNAGFCSCLKGRAFAVVASMLCISPEPEAHFQKIMDIYSILKKFFARSEYLALLAALIADKSSSENAEYIAQRGRKLFDMMKNDHPFLTSSEDSVMAGFMALSHKDDNDLINDAEACYKLLREHFSGINRIQTASHILAAIDGEPADKVRKMCDMSRRFKAQGHKFRSYYELLVLAALSAIDEAPEQIADNTIFIDGVLSGQKGYKGVFGTNNKTRLAHAAMLCADMCQDSDNAASALALIAVTEGAICAARDSDSAAVAANC